MWLRSRRSLLRIVGIAIATVVPVSYNACGNFTSHIAKEDSSSTGLAAEYLQFERAGWPEATKGAVTVSGTCSNGLSLTVQVDGVSPSTAMVCANNQFSMSLNLTGADGPKSIVISAVGASGQELKDSLSVIKDTTAPAVSVLNTVPSNGYLVVSGTCENGLTVTLGGDVLSSNTLICANSVFQISATPTAGTGSKTISASQVDIAGNNGSGSATYTPGAPPPANPVVTIASPAGGTMVKGSVTISGVCETALPVAISGAGIAAALNATCSLGFYSQMITLSSGEGAKAISVRQTNATGGSGSATVSVVKDTVAPVLTITQPAAGTLAATGVSLQGACETGLTVKASGPGVSSEMSVTCTSSSYNLPVTFSAGDGNKDVTVTSSDAAGNSSSVARQFVKGAPPVVAGFAAAKAVMSQYCTSCHAAGGQAANINFALSSEAEFVSRGLVVAGNPDQSKLIFRMLHYNGATAGGSRNMPIGYNASSFPVSAYTTLVNWVKQVKVVQPGPIASFNCVDPAARSSLPSYILSKTQYKNSMTDLFGAAAMDSVANELTTLPEEGHDANSHGRGVNVSVSQTEAYMNIATKISESYSATAFGTCANATAPTAACIDGYLNGFAKRIFRRPLTEDEKTFARGVYNRAGDYKANVRTVLAFHLQSPAFLWRFENGMATQTSTTLLKLTPYEVATRLSYMTTDSIPDATLMSGADAVAAANRAWTVAELKTQALRLMQTPRGREKMRANLMRYSMSDQVQSFTTLPAGLTGRIQTSGLAEAITSETATFIDEMVYTKRASFKTLITAKESYASHAGLASIYGHGPVSSMTAPATMAGRRQGLLMRSAFFSTPFTRTNIIRRGVNFQKRILCNEIASPADAQVEVREQDAYPEAEALLHNNRDVVAYKTRSAVCMTCHATINATGFAFESLDPFGRIRMSEPIFDKTGAMVRTLPIDTKTDVPLSDGSVLPIQDGTDLVTYIAESSEGSACFARNAFRFINEKRETADDYCALDKAHQVLKDSGKPILDAMVELVANDAILVKKN